MAHLALTTGNNALHDRMPQRTRRINMSKMELHSNQALV